MIPVCRPYLVGKEKEYAARAIEDGWISSAGEYLSKFERSFAQFVECREGVACANGTAAVYLALQVAGVGPGDRVVVPTFTMMASIFPIMMLGAIPVYVDCEADTFNLDATKLESIAGDIKAIMVVHIYGHPCDMDPIVAWARTKNAVVIEDAAEGQGALYKGKKVGALGDIAAFSFYANKVLTCGEGGMITTNNAHYAERARYYRNLCFETDPEKRFIHDEVGMNFRMTNVQAAIGYAQVEKADLLVEMRIEMARKYLKRLQSLTHKIQLPVEKPWAKNVYWMFGIVIKESTGLDAPTVVSRLRDLGVDTRRFFFPAHQQPFMKKIPAAKTDIHAPVSERLWKQGLYLPSSSDLTDLEADSVATALARVFE